MSFLDFLGWSSPGDIDSIEWFASTSDLCAAMSKLRDLGVAGDAMDLLAAAP
jgi:hypothetical protein